MNFAFLLQTLMDEGLLYKHQGKGTFIISPEKRSPEQFCTTRLLVVIPDYEGNTAQLSFYDKKLSIRNIRLHLSQLRQTGIASLRGLRRINTAI